MKIFRITLIAGLALLCATAYSQKYKPAPENLRNRKEFANERFGIFLHWGIYSTYAQGEWYLNSGKLHKDEYAKAASAFYPHLFNASDWVKAFREAGAGYVCLTSRHHDGFSMFDTETSEYDIVDATPFGRDVSAELAHACRAQGLALHFYYSQLDWIREDYPLGRTGHDTGRKGDRQDYDSYFAFMKQQLGELIRNYGPRAIWFDGYWDHDSDATPFDWRMPELYSHIHSLNPACLICNNHHIAVIEGEDFQAFEKDLPGQNTTGFAPDQKVSDALPLEMCETMNGMWGYKVSDQNYKSVPRLVQLLATCVSMNTNLLLNIGPQPNGELPALALDRLRGIGAWMDTYGSSIRGCGPGPVASGDWGVSTAPTSDPKTFYLHLFKSPGTILEVPLSVKGRVRAVKALKNGAALSFRRVKDKLFVTLPSELDESDYVVEVRMR
ncbi:MAG: alpha-L-fucosidase [Candidatus Cryptobacteroides sp.]